LVQYFHGMCCHKKNAITSINTGVLAIFQSLKTPLIRRVNGQVVEPIKVANPSRQSATPTAIE
jgi:hypothetical protein